MYTFSIGFAQHLIETDHMCDIVNDTMMVLLIVTEIRQLNILLKYYVYEKFKYKLCSYNRWIISAFSHSRIAFMKSPFRWVEKKIL